MTKIGIQGGEASYHEVAAHQLHKQADLAYYETFGDLFRALRRQEIISAVVAIVNNRVQFIPEPYEELVHGAGDLTIVGESYLQVEHALLAPKGTKLADIKEVHSQAPAIGQCRDYLSSKLTNVRIVEQHDTAGSARMVAEWNDSTKAAIASLKAAEKYGLSIIDKAIQDDPANITRFLELKLAGSGGPIVADKTTMILHTPDQAGALAEALILFRDANINLSNLHSRIVPNSAFDMDFFVELEAGIQEEHTQMVLEQLKDKDYAYKLLGSYKAANIPKEKI